MTAAKEMIKYYEDLTTWEKGFRDKFGYNANANSEYCSKPEGLATCQHENTYTKVGVVQVPSLVCSTCVYFKRNNKNYSAK